MMAMYIIHILERMLVAMTNLIMVLHYFWEPNDQLYLKLHHEIMEDKSEQGVYVNRNVVGELACTITLIGFDPNNGCR